jgi:hypothetical protein
MALDQRNEQRRRMRRPADRRGGAWRMFINNSRYDGNSPVPVGEQRR